MKHPIKPIGNPSNSAAKLANVTKPGNVPKPINVAKPGNVPNPGSLVPDNQRVPGFDCPKCKFFIEVSIQSLLYEDTQKCPGCGTVYSMDRGHSSEALRIVQKLHVAMQNLETVKKFNNAPKI